MSIIGWIHADETVAHYVLRERDRIADERDHMERHATLTGYERYDRPRSEVV